MITEKALLLRRGNDQDKSSFLATQKNPNSNLNRYDRVAHSHALVKELLNVPILQCESKTTDDEFGYSEDYSFYVGNSTPPCIKLNFRTCDQWQKYSRSIYKPSTLLDYNKLFSQCQESLLLAVRQPVVNVLFEMMKTAQQNYIMYVDGSSNEFMFSIENNQKFSKLTLEVNLPG